MDLALDYLARTTHEQNVAAAVRITAYRRRVAERRALEAHDRAHSTRITSARADRSWWWRLGTRPFSQVGRDGRRRPHGPDDFTQNPDDFTDGKEVRDVRDHARAWTACSHGGHVGAGAVRP